MSNHHAVTIIGLAGSLILAAGPATSAAAAKTPTTTTVYIGGGHGFITIGMSSQDAASSNPAGTITVTLTDATTHHRLGSFTRPAVSPVCALEKSARGGKVTFSTPKRGQPGETSSHADLRFQPCRIGRVSGRASDQYTVTAAYHGSGMFAPSVSTPVAI